MPRTAVSNGVNGDARCDHLSTLRVPRDPCEGTRCCLAGKREGQSWDVICECSMSNMLRSSTLCTKALARQQKAPSMRPIGCVRGSHRGKCQRRGLKAYVRAPKLHYARFAFITHFADEPCWSACLLTGLHPETAVYRRKLGDLPQSQLSQSAGMHSLSRDILLSIAS